jgi:hypothetical protein
MVIDDFDVKGVSIVPLKTNTPLLIYSDGILSLSRPSEGVKLIPRIQHQGI